MLTLVLACCVAACGPDEPPGTVDPPAGGWQGTIEQFGNVVTVRNPVEGLWDGIDPAPVRFELDATFGGPQAGIGQIGAAIVDNQGDVYIYDRDSHQLVALRGTDGSVRWRAGAEGEGTGEFRQVRGAAYDGDGLIWLVNQEGRRLDGWSLDGEPVRSIDLDGLGVGATYMGGWLGSGRIALLTAEVFNSATNAYVVIELEDDEPAVIDRFRIGTDPMMPIPPGIVLQLSHYFADGRIYMGTWERYILREYNDAGQLRRRVLRPVDYLRRPGFAARGDRFAAIPFGGLGAPIVLPDGYWVVVASWPTNVDDSNAYVEMPASERPPISWSSSIDLFDPEGRFLLSTETPGSPIPDIGRPWVGDRDGNLYTVIGNPYPQVRRYRVVFEPPP